MILAKDLYLPESYKSNQNVLVLDVPGSGKTRGHVLPNLMEMNSSFVVLDPKGELYSTASDMLRHRGYHVQCVDFDTPMQSPDFYNPLEHIHSEDDILRMTELIVGESRKTSKDTFWPTSAQILANSMVGYLVSECKGPDRTLEGMTKLLRVTDAEHKGGVMDKLIRDMAAKDPHAFAVEQFDIIKTCSSAEKTFSCIIISLAATFSGIMSKGMKYLTGRNTVDFRRLGHEKTAIFVKSSDTDRSKDFLVNILFQQAIDELCREADAQPSHSLPVHVHLFLDDFGTNLTLNRFDAAIAGMRSREISCSVILQSEGQLKQMYGDAWTTIFASCAAYVFLGSNDVETCRDVSIRLDKPIRSVLYKKYSDIYIFRQGEGPKCRQRYDVTSHKLYRLLRDGLPEGAVVGLER